MWKVREYAGEEWERLYVCTFRLARSAGTTAARRKAHAGSLVTGSIAPFPTKAARTTGRIDRHAM